MLGVHHAAVCTDVERSLRFWPEFGATTDQLRSIFELVDAIGPAA